MSKSKKKSYKAKLKSRVVPCTDANQRIQESNSEKDRQRKAIIKKIAEIRAKQALAQSANVPMGTIDGLAE